MKALPTTLEEAWALLQESEPGTSPFCEARNSVIHGQGVFATETIRKGWPVIAYAGEKVTKDEGNRRGLAQAEKAKQTGEAAVYVFILNDEWDIDGNFDYNTARLINHSCQPNCETEIDQDRIWVVALKKIRKGEELSFDYGFDLDDFEDHPCLCGTDDCCGYIVGQDYRVKLAKKLKKRRKAARKKKGKASKKKGKGQKRGPKGPPP
ncbi:MAG: SET domain-containing protein-lysine N-methyltransferase [Verrucomicrobiota bacterium]